MIRRILSCLALMAVAQLITNGQTYPPQTVIIEQRTLTAERQLVLWMENPTLTLRGDMEDEIYTCPEETRGSYYSGKVMISLVDLKRTKILNTIEIEGNGISSEDNEIDIPFWIHRGYYTVPLINEKNEGKPMLMDLKDYNHDGTKFEFALFDAVACMGLPSTLIGYSEKQDKVIQYQTRLTSSDGTSLDYWVDYLFRNEADDEGVRRYEIDYRGRGGLLDKYEIRYDRENEIFVGRIESFIDEN